MVDITYLAGYTKRKAISIDHTKVSATLSNFPVLVKIINDTDIGASALSTGYDIRFTSDDETTLLDYERESFSITGGACTAVFWVRIPALSSSVDTEIFMYYGKADATDGQNKTAVWDTNYKGVWHLSESGTGTAGDYKDSTSYGNNSTNTTGQPTRTTGKIIYGQQFDNVDDKIECGTPANLNITGAITIEVWLNLAHKATSQPIVSKRSWNLIVSSSDVATFQTKLADDSNYDTNAVSPTLTTGVWTHLVCVYDPATDSKVIYTNGSAGTPVSKTDDATPNNSTRYFAIGKDSISNVFSPSTVEEVRISNIARSENWASTSHANQSSPSTFFSLGTEETDTPTTTVNPAIIEFNEDNEMKQFVGTSRKHPVRPTNDSTGAPVIELTNPTFYVSVNGENRQELALTISAFDALHQWFWLTIPDVLGTITPVDGDEVTITFGDSVASGFAMVQFVAATTSIDTSDITTALGTYGAATATNVTDAVTALGGGGTSTLDSLESDIAALEITGGSSAEKIIPATYYELNPTTQTITLKTPYDTVTLEQILSIRNITQNQDIYNSAHTSSHKLTPDPETAGVFTYNYNGTMTTDDVLQIIINQV